MSEEMTKETIHGLIEPVEIDHEMRTAYIDYSMSVIVSRALPDVRDGLKPVQRRVLFGMDGLGLSYNGQTKKCARIVGEVLGKFHPHGDSSVYDAMARLAQNWNQRYPLVFGQGNFGSMDGDPVAAMRYTEAKLEKLTEDVLSDLDKDTVDFQLNFDDTIPEPTVLPTKAPLLLLNGSSGIAVGMATNMAPHNLGECCDAICAYIDNPDITTEELMEHIQGPDFPTGGIIQGRQGIIDAYNTGRGRVVVRAKTEIEELDNGREVIVVTEIPYMVNKSEMIKRIGDMVEDKKIEGIADIKELTSREGIRIEFLVKKDANANVVLNTLFKYTALQSSFAINNVALVGGRPRTLSLKEIIKCFVDFRHEVVVRRTRFELDKALKRAHILEGLLKAIDIIDEIIAIIKASRNVDEAKAELVRQFGFTEIQAAAIVEMRLRQLTGMERQKLQDEYDEKLRFIARCKEILGDKNILFEVIKGELVEIRDKYGDDRRTAIRYEASNFRIEDTIPDDEVVITISHMGYVKRTLLNEYRAQTRGGVGSKGSSVRSEDFVEHIFMCTNHNYLLFFTEKGRCYWMRAFEVPEGEKNSKGRPILNMINIEPDDKVKAYVNVENLSDAEYLNSHYIVMCTKNGIVKKTSLESYSRPRTNGIIAVGIREGDELIGARLTDGKSEILLASKKGKVMRCDEEQFRGMSRGASGVKGITLEPEDDCVIGMLTSNDENENILVVSETGYGKRSDLKDYRKTNRGGKGVMTMKVTDKTGGIIALTNVNDEEDLMIINRSGITIRMKISELRVMGRNTQGVKLINLRGKDFIASITKVPTENEEEIPVEPTETPDNVADTEQHETPTENE